MNESSFNIFNFNASRCRNLYKIKSYLSFAEGYDPLCICIQEINVAGALKVFSEKYQVFINLESGAKDGVGIVTLIKKGYKILDSIIGLNGRIIGIKFGNLQIWNVYPKSGSGFKNEREIFFREQLTELMVQWKDSTQFIFQMGDHNCTHRLVDSLYNSGQHLQAGLVKHLQINGLSDDFLNVHGNDAIMYSRITNTSKTRIDYLFSNSKACIYFQYVGMPAGLDHKAIVARYDISVYSDKELISKERYFAGWVINRRLEYDETFLSQAREIFEDIRDESEDDENGVNDSSFYWLKAKTAITELAKKREKELYWEDHHRLDILKGFYSSVVRDILNGEDCFQELEKVKQGMNEIYKDRCQLKIDKFRGLEIADHTYDIHKLQKQRKFENQSKINELKINDIISKGLPNVVEAIENKMRGELNLYENKDFDEPVTPMEEVFLSKLSKISLSDEEKEQLLCPTNSEEVSYILENEVDLDSSPGEDGLTYRFIKLFWKWNCFEYLYLHFLNFTRERGDCGLLENMGVMTVKNKKIQSIEYDKKRKLTKVNKDINLGNGKVWTNRLKKIIIPKVLPKNQFCCQSDVNIIDEVKEIRNVNKFLMGKNSGQKDGTILSIDFKDAFRSISLRWFNLVLQRLNIPKKFIDWFWMMYRDLYVVIVVNKYKSEKILVQRGFMEGSPPSMAAFVVSLIPFMSKLEEKMTGISTSVDKVHKIKLFADDLKIFIRNLSEIEGIYDVICKFEEISGLKMHRDITRDKCQALPFGNHREYTSWPEWVNVKNKIKVVGAVFSNEEDIEKLNSNLVSQNFFDKLSKSYGIRGTIFQKTYFANTFLFSKLWYLAQCFKLERKMLENILSRALKFIYAGENERPVRALNFRNKLIGGLGLINPIVKSKALLIKNMYSEFLELNCNIMDRDLVTKLYGYSDIFENVYLEGLANAPAKAIYDYLIKDLILKNGSLIPSRNEKRYECIRWSVAWKNWSNMKSLTAEEKCFAWKVQQDMLPVGSRIHRFNAERRCMMELDNSGLCQDIQTLEHLFHTCESVTDLFDGLSLVLNNYLERPVLYKDVVHFSFNHRNKKKLNCALWFAVKVLYRIYQNKSRNKAQVLREVVKDIDWNLRMNWNSGFRGELLMLKEVIENIHQSGDGDD